MIIIFSGRCAEEIKFSKAFYLKPHLGRRRLRRRPRPRPLVRRRRDRRDRLRRDLRRRRRLDRCLAAFTASFKALHRFRS